VSNSFRPTESSRRFFPSFHDGVSSINSPSTSIPIESNSPIPSTSSANGGSLMQQQKQTPMWPAYPRIVDGSKTPLRNPHSGSSQQNYDTPPFSLLSISCSPTMQSFSNSLQLQNLTGSPLTSPSGGGLLMMSSTPYRHNQIPPSQVNTISSNNPPALEASESPQPPSYPRPLSPIVVPNTTRSNANTSTTASILAAPAKRSRSKSIRSIVRAENLQNRTRYEVQ